MLKYGHFLDVHARYNGKSATFSVSVRLKVAGDSKTGQATCSSRLVAFDEAVRDALRRTEFVRMHRFVKVRDDNIDSMKDMDVLELVLAYYRGE